MSWRDPKPQQGLGPSPPVMAGQDLLKAWEWHKSDPLSSRCYTGEAALLDRKRAELNRAKGTQQYLSSGQNPTQTKKDLIHLSNLM